MIRAIEIRVVDDGGEQLGIMAPAEALRIAQERDLDLVEVAPNAKPPVCRIMNYGKFQYQKSKRAHEAKKHQKQVSVKEVKFRPKTEEHDYQFKKKHILRFLNDGNKYQIGLDPYTEGDPEDACPSVGSAPSGLFKPVRGFNRQWCNVPSVRDKLGWATGPEIGFDATWQRFANGHAFLSREGHIYAFFYATETWAYIN